MTAAVAVETVTSIGRAKFETGQFGVPDLSEVEGIVLLRYVDEYSDMVFNAAMLPILMSDLRIWRSIEPADSSWCSPAQFDELQNLVAAAKREGLYVVFLGA